MATLRIPLSFPILSTSSSSPSIRTSCCTPMRRKIGFLIRNGCSIECSVERFRFLGEGSKKVGILTRNGRKVSLAVVRGFGFGDGGGGDKSSNTRVLTNLALAIGLAYLTTTGQLGWILDAIVSIWLLAVLLPIVGIGVFFWFAGRNIVQSSCPNCGNGFQIFKSSLNDGPQLCPFCAQPFSVQGDKFVKESSRVSSSQSTKTSGQIFNGFSPRSEKGTAASATVVDIEAEVKDID